MPPPIGPSSELTHAGRPYELTLLVSTVLVCFVTLTLEFTLWIILIATGELVMNDQGLF